jgi:hypothetical protein
MEGYEEHNYPAFTAAAEKLRDEGYIVINPAENFGGATFYPRASYMRADIMNIMQADALVVLPGWRGSKGASLELLIAHELGLPILRYKDRNQVNIGPSSKADVQVVYGSR